MRTARWASMRGPVATAQAGFTLIELMVTIGVAAVLLAIAVPSFNQLIGSSRLTAQANEIVAAVNFARSEAIRRNTTTTFCRASGDRDSDTTCAGATGDWQYWMVRTNAGVIRRGAVRTFGGMMVVRSTLIGDQATFGSDGLRRPNGTLVADPELRVCSRRVISKNTRTISLGIGSRVSTVLSDLTCPS